MTIIIVILVIFFIITIVLRKTAKIWAPLLMVLVVMVVFSIFFAPRVTTMNSIYYVHKYNNVVEENYDAILQSLNKGETKTQLDNQLQITDNSIYLLNNAGKFLPLFGGRVIKKCTNLTQINTEIRNKDLTANQISELIKTKCL